MSELKQYEALENYTDERYNVALQFPFSASPVLSSAASYATPSQRAEEEERLNEKKNAFRNKMKEIAEQKRLEKLAQLESEVNGLIGMKERRSLYADEDEYLVSFYHSAHFHIDISMYPCIHVYVYVYVYETPCLNSSS